MIEVRLFINTGDLTDFARMNEIFNWLDGHNITSQAVYRTKVIHNIGDFYYDRSTQVEYLRIGLPDDLALLAKLTWGGK